MAKYRRISKETRERILYIFLKTIYNQIQMLRKHLHNLMLSRVRNGKLIFIDESGFQLAHRRNHGRAKVGIRPVLIEPRIKSINLTVMASMSSIGVEHFKVLESNRNTVNFLAFLRELFQRLANSRREN